VVMSGRRAATRERRAVWWLPGPTGPGDEPTEPAEPTGPTGTRPVAVAAPDPLTAALVG
jgi:hypothetical protein